MVKEKYYTTFSCGHKELVNKDVVECPECGTKLKFGDKVEFVGKFIEQTDEKRNNIITKLIDYCDKKNYYIDYYIGIAEIGYEDKLMICADWNPDHMKKIYNYLDRNINDLLELSWSDEWTSCSFCYKAVRTSPDSYGWQASYLMTEYEIICHECIKDDPEILIEELINRDDKAVRNWGIPYIEKAGFVCLEDMDFRGNPSCQRFETGFHPGQNDDPKKVIKELEKEFGVDDLTDIYDYIFAINNVQQFDIHWSMYLREKEK